MAWMWWVGGALLLGIAEVLSLTLVLVMFAGGALAAALASLLGAPFWLQAVVAAVVSALLLTTLRPWILRHYRRRKPLVETNSAALVGRSAVVVLPVDGQTGRVKLAGEVWSARCEGGLVLDPGVEVRVARIDGATAVVVPLGEPSAR